MVMGSLGHSTTEAELKEFILEFCEEGLCELTICIILVMQHKNFLCTLMTFILSRFPPFPTLQDITKTVPRRPYNILGGGLNPPTRLQWCCACIQNTEIISPVLFTRFYISAIIHKEIHRLSSHCLCFLLVFFLQIFDPRNQNCIQLLGSDSPFSMY